MIHDDVVASCRQSGFRFYASVVATSAFLATGLAFFVATSLGWRAVPGVAFGGVATFVLGLWGGFWTLWRLSFRLETTKTTLRWRSILRRGEVSLSNLRRISASPVTPWRGPRELIVFRVRSGPAIMIMVFDGLIPFVREVEVLAPGVGVEPWW